MKCSYSRKFCCLNASRVILVPKRMWRRPLLPPLLPSLFMGMYKCVWETIVGNRHLSCSGLGYAVYPTGPGAHRPPEAAAVGWEGPLTHCLVLGGKAPSQRETPATKCPLKLEKVKARGSGLSQHQSPPSFQGRVHLLDHHAVKETAKVAIVNTGPQR